MSPTWMSLLTTVICGNGNTYSQISSSSPTQIANDEIEDDFDFNQDNSASAGSSFPALGSALVDKDIPNKRIRYTKKIETTAAPTLKNVSSTVIISLLRTSEN